MQVSVVLLCEEGAQLTTAGDLDTAACGQGWNFLHGFDLFLFLALRPLLSTQPNLSYIPLSLSVSLTLFLSLFF